MLKSLHTKFLAIFQRTIKKKGKYFKFIIKLLCCEANQMTLIQSVGLVFTVNCQPAPSLRFFTHSPWWNTSAFHTVMVFFLKKQFFWIKFLLVFLNPIISHILISIWTLVTSFPESLDIFLCLFSGLWHSAELFQIPLWLICFPHGYKLKCQCSTALVRMVTHLISLTLPS